MAFPGATTRDEMLDLDRDMAVKKLSLVCPRSWNAHHLRTGSEHVTPAASEAYTLRRCVPRTFGSGYLATGLREQLAYDWCSQGTSDSLPSSFRMSDDLLAR